MTAIEFQNILNNYKSDNDVHDTFESLNTYKRQFIKSKKNQNKKKATLEECTTVAEFELNKVNESPENLGRLVVAEFRSTAYTDANQEIKTKFTPMVMTDGEYNMLDDIQKLDSKDKEQRLSIAVKVANASGLRPNDIGLYSRSNTEECNIIIKHGTLKDMLGEAIFVKITKKGNSNKKFVRTALGKTAYDIIQSSKDQNPTCSKIIETEHKYIKHANQVLAIDVQSLFSMTEQKLIDVQKPLNNIKADWTKLNTLVKQLPKSALNISNEFDANWYTRCIDLQWFDKDVKDDPSDTRSKTHRVPMLGAIVNGIETLIKLCKSRSIDAEDFEEKCKKLETTINMFKQLQDGGALSSSKYNTNYSTLSSLMSRVARINNFACTGRWFCPECGKEMESSKCCNSCGYTC